MNRNALQKMAKRKARALRRHKRDPRYLETLGRFVAVGLLHHPSIPAYLGPVSLESALWAGTLEPRILELIPAVLLKMPRLITIDAQIPDDLNAILRDLRRGRLEKPFRGIPAKSYGQWITRLGHVGKTPSLVKNFRFKPDDLALLENLQAKYQDSEIGIIRRALKQFAACL